MRIRSLGSLRRGLLFSATGNNVFRFITEISLVHSGILIQFASFFFSRVFSCFFFSLILPSEKNLTFSSDN